MACINLMRPMLLRVGQDGIDTCISGPVKLQLGPMLIYVVIS